MEEEKKALGEELPATKSMPRRQRSNFFGSQQVKLFHNSGKPIQLTQGSKPPSKQDWHKMKVEVKKLSKEKQKACIEMLQKGPQGWYEVQEFLKNQRRSC